VRFHIALVKVCPELEGTAAGREPDRKTVVMMSRRRTMPALEYWFTGTTRGKSFMDRVRKRADEKRSEDKGA
jgi:hypothetical protein